MQKKILSDQNLEELKITEKKTKSLLIIYAVLLFILAGIAVYFTMLKGFSVFIIFPTCCLPFFMYTAVNLKKVKDEIKIRTMYISLRQSNDRNS